MMDRKKSKSIVKQIHLPYPTLTRQVFFISQFFFILSFLICFLYDSAVIGFLRSVGRLLWKRSQALSNSQNKGLSAVPAANSALSPRPAWKSTSSGTLLHPLSNASAAATRSAVPTAWPVTFNRTTRKSRGSAGSPPGRFCARLPSNSPSREWLIALLLLLKELQVPSRRNELQMNFPKIAIRQERRTSRCWVWMSSSAIWSARCFANTRYYFK